MPLMALFPALFPRHSSPPVPFRLNVPKVADVAFPLVPILTRQWTRAPNARVIKLTLLFPQAVKVGALKTTLLGNLRCPDKPTQIQPLPNELLTADIAVLASERQQHVILRLTKK